MSERIPQGGSAGLSNYKGVIRPTLSQERPDPARIEGHVGRGAAIVVVLAARGPVGFVDPTLPYEAELVAAHGSMTASEIEVPLVAARGRAR